MHTVLIRRSRCAGSPPDRRPQPRSRPLHRSLQTDAATDVAAMRRAVCLVSADLCKAPKNNSAVFRSRLPAHPGADLNADATNAPVFLRERKNMQDLFSLPRRVSLRRWKGPRASVRIHAVRSPRPRSAGPYLSAAAELRFVPLRAVQASPIRRDCAVCFPPVKGMRLL